MDGLEPAEGVGQDPDVGGRVAVLGVLRHAEQGAGGHVQRHAPLDGVEEEQLAPRLLQQDHLGAGGRHHLEKI